MKIELVDYRGKNRAFCINGPVFLTLRVVQDDGAEHEFNVPVRNLAKKGEAEALVVDIDSLNLRD